MAGRKPLLRVGSDVREALRGMDQVKDKAKEVGRLREEARLQVQTDAANARLDILNARLERYGAQEQTATVKIASGRAAAEIDRIEARLDRLGRKDVHVSVKVRQSVLGALSGAGGSIGGSGLTGFAGTLIGGATSAISALAGAAGSGVQAVAGLAPGISSGTASMAGMGAEAVVVIPLIVSLAAAITVLIGVLGALAASFAAAVAGAGLLAGAFGLAMAPAAILVFGAIAKVVAIFGALKTQEQQHVSNTAAMQAAAAQRVAAQEQLAAAIKNVAEQRIAAQQAEQDAAAAIPRDQLGVDEAKLGIEQARRALQKFREEAGLTGRSFDGAFQKFQDVSFHPTASGIKDALGGHLDKDQELQLEQLLLNERGATLNLSDAIRKLGRDRQTEADFAKNGLKAYGPYAAALDQVAAAQRRVDAATRAATKAQATQAGKLAELTPREQALARSLGRIKDAFEKAFGPAVDNVLGGIVRGIGFVARALEGPRIRSALTSLGSALGGAFARIGRFFANPANIAALVSFINAGKALIRPLTTLFITFSRVVRDLALDALPRLISGVKTFAANVTTWEKQHGGAKKLQGTVNGLIDSFHAWLKIGQGLASIVIAFLRGGKKDGDSFAGSLGDVLKTWGKWLNSKDGQKGIITFFHTVHRLVTDLIAVLEHLLKVWEQAAKVVSASKATTGILDTLSKVLPEGPGKGAADIAKSIKHFLGLSSGGVVPGTGRGDHVPALLEPGEFVVKRAVVNAIGLPSLTRLNAGAVPAMAMAGGGGSGHPMIGHQQVDIHINTPAGEMPDGAYLGSQLHRALSRMGRG